MPNPWQELTSDPELMALLGYQIYSGALTDQPFSGLMGGMAQLPSLLRKRREEEEEKERREEEYTRRKRLDELLIAARENELQRVQEEPAREDAALRLQGAADQTRRAAAMAELGRAEPELLRTLRHAPTDLLERRAQEARTRGERQGELQARQAASLEAAAQERMLDIEEEARGAEAQRVAFEQTTGIEIGPKAWAALTRSERSDLVSAGIMREVVKAEESAEPSKKEQFQQLEVYNRVLQKQIDMSNEELGMSLGDDNRAAEIQRQLAGLRDEQASIRARMGELLGPTDPAAGIDPTASSSVDVASMLRAANHPDPEAAKVELERLGILPRVQELVAAGMPLIQAIKRASQEKGL